MNIFTLNAGSSSLKCQLRDMEHNRILMKCYCERIGLDGRFTWSTWDGRGGSRDVEMPDYFTAFRTVFETLEDGKPTDGTFTVHAIGHRAVNGGDLFEAPVLVTENVLRQFESLLTLAPLHNPPAFALLKACIKLLPQVPNVLVFDTAFHQTMPPEAYLFAIPYRFYTHYGLRRYGAHGSSHRYVAMRCAKLLNRPLETLRIITCHLGNGSSLCAIDHGRCIDTSMGLTPLGGIPMGTRCGDLDPSVVTFLMEKEGLDAPAVEQLLNKQSGLLGVSGVSSDLSDVLAAADEGNEQAAVAVRILSYQIRKFIGAYAAALDGVDAIVFTAGIGENAVSVRQAVCNRLSYLGVQIDPVRNGQAVHGLEREISTQDAKTRVFVIPTDEEHMIALDTQNLLEQQPEPPKS